MLRGVINGRSPSTGLPGSALTHSSTYFFCRSWFVFLLFFEEVTGLNFFDLMLAKYMIKLH
jgi:hypothetical protein